MSSTHLPKQPPAKTLEYWLNKATDPFTEEEERQSFVKGFCDQLNQELEGPPVACRLLSHKIQSPQEAEAFQALMVTDACVRSCGPRFHNEIGKFKFLNELIKILSPKYLGDKTTDHVKTKAIEYLYSWAKGLKHLPKIRQAYDMLKEQGIVSRDPTYMDEIYVPPPPPPKARPSILDEEKSRQLAELLASKKPDDLQAANRLIKSMVKEEERKLEHTLKRSETIETTRNNVRLLSEMLENYNSSSETSQETEIIKELYDACCTGRPKLFQFAAEAAEKEEPILTEILLLNDEVSKVLDDCRLKFPARTDIITKSPRVERRHPTSESVSLMNLDIPHNLSAFVPNSVDSPASSESSLSYDDVTLLGSFGTPLITRKSTKSSINELSDLFGPLGESSQSTGFRKTSYPDHMGGRNQITPSPLQQQPQQQTTPSSGPLPMLKPTEYKPKGLLDLDELSESLIQQNLPAGTQLSSTAVRQKQRIPLNELPKSALQPVSLSPLDPYAPLRTETGFSGPPAVVVAPTPADNNSVSSSNVGLVTTLIDRISSDNQTTTTEGSWLKHNSQSDSGGSTQVPPTPNATPLQSGKASPVLGMGSSTVNGSLYLQSGENRPPPCSSLEGIEVELASIKPGSRPPYVIMDQGGIRLVLNYAANQPKPDVITTVIWIASSRQDPIADVQFAANFPSEFSSKGGQLKLQEPTARQLPAYNAILPQSAITQVLLLSVPSGWSKVTVDYTLTFTYQSTSHSISGFFDVQLRDN